MTRVGFLLYRTMLRCIAVRQCFLIMILLAGKMAMAQDINTLRSGIVKLMATVEGRQKTGTGVIVKQTPDTTFIVTASHVVEGDKFPKVEFYTRRNALVEAEVLEIEGGDPRGIALLKILNKAQVPQNVVVLPFASLDDVEDGEDLTTIGFPSGGGLWDVLKVTITSRYGRDLKLSGDWEEGNSGGPILKHGKIVGLVTGMNNSRGQAIPAEIVAMTLKGWDVTLTKNEMAGTSSSVTQAPRMDSNTSTSTTVKPQKETRLLFEPEMVRIPPGKFMMGSPISERGRLDEEGPQHKVTIQRPFTISRYEITVGQFRQFVQDKDYHRGKEYVTFAEQDGNGCLGWNTDRKQPDISPERNWKNPGFDQSVYHPVTCVSWDDTQAYVAWLSRRTGLKYRLPTEAEWEYAARAGTISARFYSDDKQCDYANGAGQELKVITGEGWFMADCQDYYIYTAPVASFTENHFGLFDMLGNVMEWTQDCWHGNYQNAPKDGSAWLKTNGGDCGIRVVRGGSWNNYPQILRSAFRIGFSSGGAFYDFGFRVARDL